MSNNNMRLFALILFIGILIAASILTLAGVIPGSALATMMAFCLGVCVERYTNP